MPRQQWPLWSILACCIVWIAVIAVRSRLEPTGTSLGAVADAFLPLTIALLTLTFVRGTGRRPDVDLLERRLATANRTATALEVSLRAVDATLADCATRTETMAAAASDRGNGLVASATLLTSAAAEVEQSGSEAERVAETLLATMPRLETLSSEIDAVGRKLGTDTARQMGIIDALLAAVQVRGDEVSIQADAAIASMNKQLADVDEQSRQTTTKIAKRAYALDAAVDGALERATTLLDTVGQRIAAQTEAMDARLASMRTRLDEVGDQGSAVIGARLDRLIEAAGQVSHYFGIQDEQSARLIERTDAHLASLPVRLGETGEAGSKLLTALIGRIDIASTRLVDLGAPFASASTAVEAMGEQIGHLERLADAFAARLHDRLPAVSTGLSTVETGTAALVSQLDGLRAVLGQSDTAAAKIAAAVDATRISTAALGEVDMLRVGERLTGLITAAADLGQRIEAQAGSSEQARLAVEGDLATLGTRLDAVHASGEGRLGDLSDRVGALHLSIGALERPLDTVRKSLGDVDADVGRIDDAVATLGTRLGGHLENADAAFAGLSSQAAGLLAQSGALEAAIAGGSTAIGSAADAFARERTGFTAAADALGVQFDRARAMLDALGAKSAQVGADTADQLGPVFERARTLAEQSAEALRTMLDQVVTEAERALARSGSATAEAAFGVPIRAELAAIEDAVSRAGTTAEAAAKRVAGQARALSTAVDAVDAKVAEIETRLDVRARDTLSARSTRLIAKLGEASVDVTRLLAIDAGEQAWLRYAKGDRSIFARRAARLIDRPTAAKIARHFAHDADFREEASRYLDLFETLSRRLLSDPDGEALLATVVSSDIGKLYVAIARSTGRWLPAAA